MDQTQLVVLSYRLDVKAKLKEVEELKRLDEEGRRIMKNFVADATKKVEDMLEQMTRSIQTAQQYQEQIYTDVRTPGDRPLTPLHFPGSPVVNHWPPAAAEPAQP